MIQIWFAIFMGLLGAFAQASSICTGDAKLTHQFTQPPMTSVRKLIVSFSPSIEVCEHLLTHGPAEAMVVIDFEGEPLELDGPIVLDGSRANVIRYENGDSFEVWLQWLPGKRLRFSMQSGWDGQSTAPPLLSIEPVELVCL